MKKKKGLIISGTGLGIIVILCILTAISTFTWVSDKGMKFEFFAIDHISAELSDTLSFQSEAIKKIVITSNGGDITLQPGDTDEISVDLVKTGWGGTQEEALEKAENLEVISKKVEDILFLTYNRPSILRVITYQGGSNTIDIILNIPSNISVEVSSRDGDIFASNIESSIDLEGKFGDIFIANVSGKTNVNNRDGEISIMNLHASGEDVTIMTEFGDIEINGLSSQNLGVTSRDGKIDIQDLKTSGNINIVSEFGNISLKDFDSKQLEVNARDGNIKLFNGTSLNGLYIESKFGDIEIAEVTTESYTLVARDGDVEIINPKGLITANNQFGDITIENASDVTLATTLRDGTINFSGSLNHSTDHFIETKFGDVVLSIPGDISFNVHLETKYGEINSEIPITIILEPDSPIVNESDKNIFEGQINEGGALITIIAEDGDINLNSHNQE